VSATQRSMYPRSANKPQSANSRQNAKRPSSGKRKISSSSSYTNFEEVQDPGQSGASLERPGMDRVRDLVAAGGVSVVLSQDRDRFAREPAYHYFLRREFEEHGTKIRTLNDRGDESPEGELTDGILDQLAKYERAKIAERSRRGKLQKARQGKVLAGPRPNYGFRYNSARDNYVVDEDTMRVIGRIFRMVGAEGQPINAVKSDLDREGVSPPCGGRFWSPKKIRDIVLDDVYRSHAYEEIEPLVSPEVAVRLESEKRYGIWWFNRRRYETKQVGDAGPEGRRYRRQIRVMEKPRSEWIAVPVPDSGIPREWVDRAREAIWDNTRPSANADRVWELSGGVFCCGECGCRMMAHTTTDPKRGKRKYHYYHCPKRGRHGVPTCSNRKNHRAEDVELLVWGFVSSLLKDPERLRVGLERMIEEERAGMRGDPDQEAKAWLERLSEFETERRGYIRLAAKGHMTDEELDEALSELDNTRRTAEKELDAIKGRKEVLEQLERDRDALLEYYARMVPEALDALVPEERRQVYGMLRLKVEVAADGAMEICGILSENLCVLYEHGEVNCEEGLCENGRAYLFTIS
jgi:site-specific DNA recombinase